MLAARDQRDQKMFSDHLDPRNGDLNCYLQIIYRKKICPGGHKSECAENLGTEKTTDLGNSIDLLQIVGGSVSKSI